MTKNPYERNIKSKCSVCKQNIMIDQIGNGDKCMVCGWKEDITGAEFPDRVIGPNFVSLNKARELYKNNKPLIPDFDDFMGMYMFYGEVEFTYKGIVYYLWGIAEKGIEYGAQTEEVIYYKTVKEFEDNAKTLDGKFVKDVWDEVVDANWMQ